MESCVNKANTEISSNLSEKSLPWFNAIQQSYTRNRILDHCNIISVAVLIDSLPRIFPLRFQFFANQGIGFFLDNRSQLFSSLLSQPSEFLWHLPLTSEFFKLSGLVTLISDEEALSKYWSSLNSKEKECYCGLPPDININNRQTNNDIDSFKPQEALRFSQNFSIITLIPNCVEHAIFIDKSAIGNTRKTYESLPQPDSISRKWVHKKIDGIWETLEKSAPMLRP